MPGAAGKLRPDLLSLKANGILVIDLRQGRMGTQEQSQFASLFVACLLMSRQYCPRWCRGTQTPGHGRGGIISSAY